MVLIDKVRVIKLLLFALFMMVSMVTPAQSQVDWSIKAGIGMANIIGDNMGSPKVGTFIKYYKISQLIHTQSIAN